MFSVRPGLLRALVVPAALVAALSLSGFASAQTATGVISGSVVDPQGAAIPGAGDLIDRFENNLRPGVAGHGGGAVGRVVVANDQFGGPAAARKRGCGRADAAQGFADEPLFVDGLLPKPPPAKPRAGPEAAAGGSNPRAFSFA